MRCYSCNNILNTQESLRKFSSGEFTEMCNKCLSTISDDVSLEEDTYEPSEDEHENFD